MKRFFTKKTILIASAALLLMVTVGVTLAYVFTQTQPVENKFQPSKVQCAVVEKEGEPVEGGNVNTGSVKEKVQIKNTGNTDAYIRVALVINWVNADGSRVWATAPKESEYTITFNNTDWFKGSDGYYYCKTSIAPGNLTPVLIERAQLKENVTPPVGTDGTQYYFSIEVVASAIQANPTSTVKDKWGVTVDSNGNLVSK